MNAIPDLRQTHLLYGQRDGMHLRMWQKAAPKIKANVLFQPMVPNNSALLFPGILPSQKPGTYGLQSKVEHLACFLGGVMALSSRLPPYDKDDLEVAAKLTNGCVWGYEQSPSGIMPDIFETVSCINNQLDCPWDSENFAYASPPDRDGLPDGFSKIERPEYLLRPEAIESVFVMYRLTGDEVWREKGWMMFEAIRNVTRAQYGHSGISNVMGSAEEVRASQIDKMESFWLSETLKYFYLLFSDPRLISLDDWVFNTEAHPLRLDDEYRGDA
jgi:mannosyl-oligosaccharide alpha-1,2-mannosidase